MKNNILITCLMIAGFNVPGVAQEVSWFQAEQLLHFQGKNCKPGSRIQFYSERWGGHVVKEVMSDSKGGFEVTEDIGFKTSFELDKGTSKVTFWGDREFLIENIDIKSDNGEVLLSWSAVTNPKEKISFEIFKSDSKGKFAFVRRITAAASAGILSYSYKDDETAVGTAYMIKVVNAETGIRYVSTKMLRQGAGILIYPTATNEVVHIKLDASENAKYRILNESGQLVKAGDLVMGDNVISIGLLPPGNYFITVENAGIASSSRLIKL